MKIKEKVYNFKTKYNEGFTQFEISLLLKEIPNIDLKKFNDSLLGSTYIIIDGQDITYKYDILNAIYYSIEK